MKTVAESMPSELLSVRLPQGTLLRLERARRPGENRASIAREAIETELRPRELARKTADLQTWIAPATRPRDFGFG
jgi:hypothetical protein